MLLANQTAGFFKIKYLKSKVNHEVCFWHAKKHLSFLQVNFIILGVRSKACPKYPKKEVCISLQYLQKKMWDEVLFVPAQKDESFLPGDSIKVLKITSLQYICNISAKTGRMKLIFCLQVRIKNFFKLILLF